MSDAAVSAPPVEATPAQDPALATNPAAIAASEGSKENAVKEAAAEARRKLKIDDQEVDEEEVLKIYKERKGHQQAANKILQEGKAAKKQAEEFVRMMKDKGKLFEAIQKLGHDPRSLAEEFLAAQLEEEMLDPRERELKQAKQKLQMYEEMEKAKKAETERRRDEELKKKYAEDYQKQFIDALKETQLPPTKPMVAEMAKYIHRAAKMNFEMTAKEAAQLVKEDLQNSYMHLYGEADAETLVRLLGDQALQKIRTYDTGKLKNPEAHLRTPSEQPEPGQRARNSNKRMTPQEWRDFNRK
jgi:hypothetical protein